MSGPGHREVAVGGDQHVVRIPRMNDSATDYATMFSTVDSVLASTASHIVFDFTSCSFIQHNGVALVGGLARLCERRGKRITFDWDTARRAVRTNLEQNGFVWKFGGLVGPWPGNSIPYREDLTEAPQELMRYLDQSWLREKWVHLSETLSRLIRGNVWEIFANAFEHSQSPVGVFTCGQHYPTKQEVCLSVVDYGIGIPRKVQEYRRRSIPPRDALRWAFREGNSTAPGTRGLGLGLLEDFVRINKGKLEIYSGKGYAMVHEDGTIFGEVAYPFAGTIVDIRLKCNETYYRLRSETPATPVTPLF